MPQRILALLLALSGAVETMAQPFAYMSNDEVAVLHASGAVLFIAGFETGDQCEWSNTDPCSTNLPPVARITQPLGEMVSVVEGGNLEVAGYGWDLEDGDLSSSASWKLDGSIQAAGPTASFSFGEADIGEHDLEICVTDSVSQEACDSVSFTVTENIAPEANDDIGVADQLTICPIPNDTDIDQGPLPLTVFSIVPLNPGDGEIEIDLGTQCVTFLPEPGFSGVSNWRYTNWDGLDESNVAYVVFVILY